ncbi:hypothetical protein R3X25_05900 [Lutibacter sp. TH_r2]|uniref:hypothetical protein n=1 Tax=Lutibacter sp. TH_r2 TaxID=3082083 RepID=UPI002955BAE5|nr:hypothetical protein [Lutibacter sp. TH_r2]MDV7186810.1 hypothetical protein [Lutibacter sp. TH_r2]
MNTFRNNYVLKFLSFVSLSVLILSIVNNSVFIHAHQLQNGEIVIHAHPFNQHDDNAPLKSHHHNSLEFLVLSAFHIFTISIFLFSALKLTQVFISKIYFYKTLIKQTYFHFTKNKSPPFKIILNT